MAEIKDLLKRKPDLKKFPNELHQFQPTEQRNIFRHHLARLLCGNPTQIRMLASIYSDPEHPITLVGLYEKLCDETGSENDDNVDALMHAIKISTYLSIKNIIQTHPHSMELLRLVAMLPGGIEPKDLDKLWHDY